MAEERQCMCTTPEITIKLNKQGPQGKVGPQGEPGFSPYIGVANDTPSQYILRITNEDGEYLTPNLKANIPLGGSAGTVLTKNSDVDGDCSFKALPYATTSQQGVVYLATTEEALLGDPDYVITGEVLLGVLANKIGNGTITITQGGVTKGTFTTNQAGNTSISLEDTTYTAGKNIVITGGSIATASNPVFGRAISFTDRNNTEYEVLSREGTSPNTYIKVGMNYQGLQLFSGTSTITTRRSGNDYVNIDTGNISSYLPDMNNYYTTTQTDLLLDGKADISDIPTVGNGTITFTQGGVTKGTITTNQSGDTTIALDAGGTSYTAGNGIDITNDEISIDTNIVATQSDIPTNYVTTNTVQTISGAKQFGDLGGYIGNSYNLKMKVNNADRNALSYNSSGLQLGYAHVPTIIRGSDDIVIERNNSTTGVYTTAVNIDSENISTYLPTINGGNANA